MSQKIGPLSTAARARCIRSVDSGANSGIDWFVGLAWVGELCSRKRSNDFDDMAHWIDSLPISPYSSSRGWRMRWLLGRLGLAVAIRRILCGSAWILRHSWPRRAFNGRSLDYLVLGTAAWIRLLDSCGFLLSFSGLCLKPNTQKYSVRLLEILMQVYEL